MIKRQISLYIDQFLPFPVIGIFGPRQSGKTTLAKHYFNKHAYINLEDPTTRARLASDPKGFLNEYENEFGIIFDEFQYVPELLSYIQVISDAKPRPHYFIVTGSQNFLMNQAVTQSLAGRIGILTLLPLSIQELNAHGILPADSNELILNGGYPRIYANSLTPKVLYPSYIHSYVERDVRQLINVENLGAFQLFMRLCAGRVGQLVNTTDLAVNCGVSVKTVQSWFSILQASYILFLLQPYHKNFNKRLTKSPKIFFYDTGLACSLLSIQTPAELGLSLFRGHLFENFIIADIYKQYYNRGMPAPVYFWRDMNGRVEIDCLIEMGAQLVPIEIKSTQTLMSNLFDSLKNWNELAAADPEKSYLIYAGNETQKRSVGNVIGWQQAGELVDILEPQRMQK